MYTCTTDVYRLRQISLWIDCFACYYCIFHEHWASFICSLCVIDVLTGLIHFPVDSYFEWLSYYGLLFIPCTQHSVIFICILSIFPSLFPYHQGKCNHICLNHFSTTCFIYQKLYFLHLHFLSRLHSWTINARFQICEFRSNFKLIS